MKHFLVAASIVLFLFSCKKENIVLTDSIADKSVSFFQTVKAQLKDSLSAIDYSSLDSNQMYKSRDPQSKGCFVRIALLNKNIATDFILLKTDSLGNITMGKTVHVDKDSITRNNAKFRGRFNIASLDKKTTVLKTILNGKLKSIHNAMDMMEEQEGPVGEQTLPDCVITCYTTDGSSEGDWYYYGGFFDDYGGGSSYTYGYSGGGGSSSGEGSSDNTMVVKIESNNEPAIKVDDYIKCFSSVPDANAVYSITICSDLPVNNDPSKIFNWSTGSPGHSFIQLSKTSGSVMVQQNFGFYPTVSLKVLGTYPSESKIVDNGGHEFSASLTKTMTVDQFNATIGKLQTLQWMEYDINTWNCTDFALALFNTATYKPLTVPQYITEGSGEPMNTPQGLYTEIHMLQASGNTSYGTPSEPEPGTRVNESHGSCAQ